MLANRHVIQTISKLKLSKTLEPVCLLCNIYSLSVDNCPFKDIFQYICLRWKIINIETENVQLYYLFLAWFEIVTFSCSNLNVFIEIIF